LPPAVPKMRRTYVARTLALAASSLMSVAGAWIFAGFIAADGTSVLDWLRVALFAVTAFWLVWGGLAGILGVFVRRRPDETAARPQGLTAILVPIYNEDPASTFSRIAAMNRSLVALEVADRFHFAILSDSTSPEVAAQEAAWFDQLVREFHGEPRIFYRRREKNIGKKAGNIEDFMLRSGGAYDYALILDADSLMDGATIATLACRMDADERLGLLQTVPQVINAKSLFGRLMQFSSAYLAPYFARGSTLTQAEDGPYWGHNAIVRVTAFAASCGLPVLSGKPPAGGHILSHDYVEAALLARAGWKVEVDPDLGGSFEEGPENLVEYAKRDRRWCQGNLQHRRLLLAPGLKFWSRFTFLQGIMAYAASPLWLVLMGASILAAALPDRGARGSEEGIWVLAAAVAAALLAAKLVIMMRSALEGRDADFGGTARVALSVLAEIFLSTLLAPILLCYQSLAVAQILLGLDGGWPATKRSEGRIGLDQAFAASWWIMVTSGVIVAITVAVAPALVPWLLPVAVPALAAPLLISATSLSSAGRGKPLLFLTPAEVDPPQVVLDQQRILASWTTEATSLEVDATATGVGYVRA
jgi:membrane glycosyltransferase